ncbi:MAG: type II and III secretion system protein family protein [Alphaproteobacteria bacterium]
MKTLFDKKTKGLLFAGVMGVCALGAFYGSAEAAKGDLVSMNSVSGAVAPLNITLGKADIITLPEGVSDVLVADPNIIDVQAVQSNKLYTVGLNIGDTNIIILDATGNVVKRVDVHVTHDLQAIRGMVKRLFPNENVNIDIVHSQFYLTGQASTPEVSSKIANLVAHYVSDLQDTDNKSVDELISNLLQVRGEQQVMLQVKIVEAERSVLKELGLEVAANDPNESAVTTLFGRTPASSSPSNNNALSFGGEDGLALSKDAIGTASVILDTGLSGVGALGFFIDALEEQDLLNVLAEPNLTAVSGQQAGFLAGGEFPIPAGRDQNGNIVIEYREFGVSLNFKPVVLSGDRINLQLNTEVSSLDNTNAIVLSDLTVPGLDIRRAETTIEIPSGGSLMIAGLLQSQTAEGLSGLPGISNTPILGDLISSDSFQRNETELVVIVTAYMVEPFADKSKADHIPKEDKSELAKIFATNIRRMFDVDDLDLFADAGRYGYIVD